MISSRALVLAVVLALVTGCAAERLPASDGGRTETPESTQSRTLVPSIERTAATPDPSDKTPEELPSRVVIGDLGIDLPVVSGDVTLPGNPPDYPLCDVAQYLTTYRYLGRDGSTTWIYAHARAGMFLPLLDASNIDDGSGLLGLLVDVYSTAHQKHRYRIVDVLRHATDRGVATGVRADSRRLVLQTSEGPRGTIPKLQIAADFVGSSAAPRGTADPSAEPRSCFIP